MLQVKTAPKAASVDKAVLQGVKKPLESGSFYSASCRSPAAGLRKCYFTKAEYFVHIIEQARIDIGKKKKNKFFFLKGLYHEALQESANMQSILFSEHMRICLCSVIEFYMSLTNSHFQECHVCYSVPVVIKEFCNLLLERQKSGNQLYRYLVCFCFAMNKSWQHRCVWWECF